MGDNREALVPGRTPGGPLPGHRTLAPVASLGAFLAVLRGEPLQDQRPARLGAGAEGPGHGPHGSRADPPCLPARTGLLEPASPPATGEEEGPAPPPAQRERSEQGVRTLGSRRAASPRPRPPTRRELGPRGLSLLGRKAACRAVPAAPPPARASAQRQNKGCWQHATGVPGPARPAARFPAEAPAPPWDPRPRVLPGAGAQSGVETRALAPPA